MRTIPAFMFGLSLASASMFAATGNGMTATSNAAVKTGNAIGVITAIDPKHGTVTIKHGPIPSVGWPAMTMTFRAEPATLLKSARVGQRVSFTARVKGMDAKVTRLAPH